MALVSFAPPGSDGRITQLRGAVVRLLAFEAPRGRAIRGIVDAAIEAISRADDEAERIAADKYVSDVGKAERFTSLFADSLTTVEAGEIKLRELISAREAEVASLLAIPAAKDVGEIIIDREIREWFERATPEQRQAGLGDARIVLAVARAPVPGLRERALHVHEGRVREQHAERFRLLDERAADERAGVAALRAARDAAVAAGRLNLTQERARAEIAAELERRARATEPYDAEEVRQADAAAAAKAEAERHARLVEGLH